MRPCRTAALVVVTLSVALASIAACIDDGYGFAPAPPAADADVDAQTVVSVPGDAALDSGIPDAASTCTRGAFTKVVLVPSLSGDLAVEDLGIALSRDESIAYLSTRTSDASATLVVLTAKRRPDGTFGPLSPFDPINDGGGENFHVTSARNDTDLFFVSTRPPSQSFALWRMTRPAPGASFAAPRRLAALDTALEETSPFFADGDLYFARGTGTGRQLMRVAIDTTDGVGPVDSLPELGLGDAGINVAPLVTSDGLTLYFGSNRGNDSAANGDVWTASRVSPNDRFATPTKVEGPELNTLANERPGFVSPDGCRLYFTSNRSDGGVTSVWLASRDPL